MRDGWYKRDCGCEVLIQDGIVQKETSCTVTCLVCGEEASHSDCPPLPSWYGPVCADCQKHRCQGCNELVPPDDRQQVGGEWYCMMCGLDVEADNATAKA